jgi:hypothetical protein
MSIYDHSVLQTKTGGYLIKLIKNLSAPGRRSVESLREAERALGEYNIALKLEHHSVKAKRNEVSNDTNI